MSEAVYTSGSALYIKARGRDQSAAATDYIFILHFQKSYIFIPD